MISQGLLPALDTQQASLEVASLRDHLTFARLRCPVLRSKQKAETQSIHFFCPLGKKHFCSFGAHGDNFGKGVPAVVGWIEVLFFALYASSPTAGSCDFAF